MKSAIVINPDLPIGYLANAVACITSGLFNAETNILGPEVKGKNVDYLPITKIPILILKPGNKTLLELCRQAQNLPLKYMAFTKEAQSTTDYDAYSNAVADQTLESVTLLGLGVVGEDSVVNSLVGSLPMLR